MAARELLSDITITAIRGRPEEAQGTRAIGAEYDPFAVRRPERASVPALSESQSSQLPSVQLVNPNGGVIASPIIECQG
jgi:hypothetical protein